ncbi:hypothetical protein [Bdellovibrio sp.]|uniref:hypothetical protein n=1 Tax=Bdellovibrio sp. TaxID=28201 RepID=UPI0039E4AF5C
MKRMNLLVSFLYAVIMFVTIDTALAQEAAGDATQAAAPTQGAGGGAALGAEESQVKNYPESPTTVESSSKSLAAVPPEAAPQAVVKIPGLEQIQSGATLFAKYHAACSKAQPAAAFVCREDTSPKLADTIATVNMGVSALSSISVNDSCSGFAKVMDLAKMGMTAYTTICTSARAACEASCSSSKQGLEQLKKGLEMAKGTTCTPNPGVTYDPCPGYIQVVNHLVTEMGGVVQKEGANPEDKMSIAGKNKLCTYEYTKMLASALSGIASLVNSMKQGQNCDEKSNGTGTTTASTADKCKDPANATLPECICQANPRTPGCSNSYQKVGENSASSIGTGLTDKSNLGASRDLSSINLGGSEMGQGSRSENSDSGGMAGAPVGSGSAGLGGGGNLGSGSGGNRGEAAKKGLDANILGGAGGGGGGGGSWGSGGSSAGSQYRSYLPGGDKDPNKGLAGQQAWKNEVTGQGGKSNWDKIRERYRDNKNTLLNN